MKNFIFNFHKNVKFGTPFDREVIITSAQDAKHATDIFMRRFGNLKKNTINFIQEISEINENGEYNLIGEKIISN